MGPWRPSSVPENSRSRKRVRERHQRSSLCGRRSSLSPRRGARPSPELHLAPLRRLLRSSWPARSFSLAAQPLTPSQGPAGKQRRRQERRHGRRLPGSSAGSRRGGAGGYSCSRRTQPLLSPYRTRGSDSALALHPAAAVAAPSRGTARRRPPPEGRERWGGSARAAAASGRGRGAGPAGRGGAPRSSVAHSGVTSASAAPSLPGHLVRAAHTTPPPSTPATAARSARPAGRD